MIEEGRRRGRSKKLVGLRVRGSWEEEYLPMDSGGAVCKAVEYHVCRYRFNTCCRVWVISRLLGEVGDFASSDKAVESVMDGSSDGAGNEGGAVDEALGGRGKDGWQHASSPHSFSLEARGTPNG